MSNITLGQLYLKELEAEAPASRKCLELVPESLWGFKPHEKSMSLGHLVLTVAGIPAWIVSVVKQDDINFANYKMERPATAADMVKFFDNNLAAAKQALQSASDEDLAKNFSLKNGDKTLATDSKMNTVRDTINHLAHHRGQLTVYMRLNNIAVPKIYGPSADDKEW